MKKELMFSLIGYVCLLLVCLNMGLWIYLATSSDHLTFEELKQTYFSYFPTALANAFLLTVIDIGLLAITIFFLNMANSPFISSGLKITNKILIVLAGVLLIWQLFSLM